MFEMRTVLLMLLGMIFFPLGMFGQHDGHGGPGHENYHEHHRHELGLANTAVYFLGEKEFAYGLHFHYIYRIKESKFSVGAGYERIFDEHGHNSFGPLVSFMPVEGFSISFLPGIGFEDDEASEIYPVLHLELLYEFELGDFHLGPTVGFGYEPEDVHIGAGIHIGYGF